MERSLVIAAVAVLAALGLVSLYSILVYAELSSDRYFAYSPAYQSFTRSMDNTALPFAAAFMLVLALCIPRRVVQERSLKRLSAAIVGVSIPLYLLDYRAAVAAIAGFALVLQLVVLLRLHRGDELSFLFSSQRKRVGSALTHLGVPAVLLGAMSFQLMPALFWAASAVLCAGILLLFYGGEDDKGWSG